MIPTVLFLILLPSLCENVCGQNGYNFFDACLTVARTWPWRCAVIAYKCVCAGVSPGLTPCVTARDCVYRPCQCQHVAGQATK
ncbi:hypothetical protein AAVH_15809, partial [Aphelenchoides avenae]